MKEHSQLLMFATILMLMLAVIAMRIMPKAGYAFAAMSIALGILYHVIQRNNE